MSHIEIILTIAFIPVVGLTCFFFHWRDKKDQRKRVMLLYGAAMAVYLLVYVMLSANGDYRQTMSGKYRLPGSLALSDQLEWFPAGTDWHHHIGIKGKPVIWNDRFLSSIFAGLIEVDRLIWHKTKSLLNE